MFSRDEEYTGPQGSRKGFTTRAPSLRDSRVFTFHNLYTADAFVIIDADTDVVAFDQYFASPRLSDGEFATDKTTTFRMDTVAGQRVIVDVVDFPEVSEARAQRYLDLLAQRDRLGFDRLEIWIGEDLRASQAYRNADTVRRALHPGRFHLAQGVAEAVLAMVRAAGGSTSLGWLKGRPGLGDRPEAAIFTLALRQQLRFVDKTRPIDDGFLLALPDDAT